MVMLLAFVVFLLGTRMHRFYNNFDGGGADMLSRVSKVVTHKGM